MSNNRPKVVQEIAERPSADSIAHQLIDYVERENRRDRYFETMRLMAWERAKAELWSMLATYHDQTEDYEAIETEIQGFIDTVEDRL